MLRLVAGVAVVSFAGCASLSPPDTMVPVTASTADVQADAASHDRAGREAWPNRGASDTLAALDPGAMVGDRAAAATPAAATSSAVEPAVAAAPAPRHADVWARIRAGFAMPALDTPLVAEKERFYLERPDYLQRMFARGGRYLYHIVEEIERRGMPTELALLPFVESAMNPTALSSAKAAGLWQFIPSTGKAYDLQQDWWVDNRRDVVKSTNAALDYLQKIYQMHGNDWFLALASYNWGEGAVGRAIKRNTARGRPADYLNLHMPAETRHYVPKLIALKNIVQRAAELGVALPHIPDRPYFVTVEKTRPIDLKLAASFAKMTVEEFVALNPAHNRPVIAATRNNEIRLPSDRVAAFLAAMARHEDANQTFASWQPYTLAPGETLASVARKGKVTEAELRSANGLQSRQRVLAGTRILVPSADVADESRVDGFAGPRVVEQVNRPARYHTVRGKESLATIASRYRVSAATLSAWNGIKGSVRRGMRLLVAPAATQTVLTDERGKQSVVSSSGDRRAARAVKARAASPKPQASSIRKVSSPPAAKAKKKRRPTS